MTKKPGGWYSFDKRDAAVNMIGVVPQSSKEKHWKNIFFLIDAGLILGRMEYMKKVEELADDRGGPYVKSFAKYRYLRNGNNLSVLCAIDFITCSL